MSVRYQDLVQRVGQRAGTTDMREARHLTGAVLGMLVHAIPPSEHLTLLGALPSPVTDVAGLPSRRSLTDVAELLGEIAGRTGRNPQQARHLTQAVLDGLGDQDPDFAAWIDSRLPRAVIAALRPEATGLVRGDGRPGAGRGDERGTGLRDGE